MGRPGSNCVHSEHCQADSGRTPPRAAAKSRVSYPGTPFADLADEVVSEVRLLRTTQAELARYGTHREDAYRWTDPGRLARSLPGLGEVGAPVLVAVMGRPDRFPTGGHFRSFTGLVPRASETGETSPLGPADEQGRIRAAAHHPGPRRRHRPQAGPQLAKIYYTQMVERGAEHLKALCVVAAALAERGWAVLRRGMPFVVCDTDGAPVSPEEAKKIIAEHWTVPPEVRARRRSTKHKIHKEVGKAPQQALAGHMNGQTLAAPTNEATFPNRDPATTPRSSARPLDIRSP